MFQTGVNIKRINYNKLKVIANEFIKIIHTVLKKTPIKENQGNEIKI